MFTQTRSRHVGRALIVIGALSIATASCRAQHARALTALPPICLAFTYEPDSLKLFLPARVFLSHKKALDAGRLAGHRAQWRPMPGAYGDTRALFSLTRGFGTWARPNADSLAIEVDGRWDDIPYILLTLGRTEGEWRGRSRYYVQPQDLRGNVRGLEVGCIAADTAA
jgi:hypothetical protein